MPSGTGRPPEMIIVPAVPAKASIAPTDRSMPPATIQRHAQRHDVDRRRLPHDAGKIAGSEKVRRGHREEHKQRRQTEEGKEFLDHA